MVHPACLFSNFFSQIVDHHILTKNMIYQAIFRTKIKLQPVQLLFQLKKHCNIVITQPRKIAAISLAHRVCQERHWQVGGLYSIYLFQ